MKPIKLRATSLPGLFSTCLLAVAVLMGAPCGLSGQQDSEDSSNGSSRSRPFRPHLEPGQLVGEISIDGRLEEEAWALAPAASGFIQGTPVEGIPAEEDTEVRVIIGGGAIYVGARMYESDPSTIVKRLVRRDQEGIYDYVSISLDPNRDLRTGYYFRVTASNVQVDQYYYNDRRLDRAWNAVWESAVHHDEQGWTAEVRIPLSQIRYESSDDVQTWGINFARKRMSSNETSYYSLRSRTREGFVSQFGTLDGVRVPRPSRRIEMRPYVLSSMHTGPSDPGDPFFDGSEASGRIGTDLRFGLGSAFTLDATINPDFGQVEADPAVINLSAFETRFEERRPFFVEDAQVFDFGLGLTGRGDELFYSRRVGRRPQGYAPWDADFSDIPTDATILGAAKVTGRTPSGLSMGVLAAVTDNEQGRAFYDDEGRYEDFLVEPRAHFGVVKLQQDFNEGASQVGGIFTAMGRELPQGGSFDFLPSQAYSTGVRFQHQWNDRDWSLAGFVAGSHVRGDPDALTRIQRSSNHYFQRPDATRFAVDSTATAMTGAQWRLQLSRQNGEHWTGSTWVGETTHGLEVNDLGYSRSSENMEAGASVNYREIRPSDWYKSYNFLFWVSGSWSHEALDDAGSWDSWESARLTGTTNLTTRSTFINDWVGDLTASFSPDHYNYGFTRGGPVMHDPGSWTIRGNVNTDARKKVSFRAGFSRKIGFADSGEDFSVNGRMSLKPSSQLDISVSPRFSMQTVTDQYVLSTSTLSYEPTYGRRYLFGEIERRTLSLETRINWTFSPDLSFQLYAQPLVSSGDYLAYKQLEAARTYDFDLLEEGTFSTSDGVVSCGGGQMCTEVEEDGDRRQHVDFDENGVADYSFGDRDFNVRSLVGNAVLRWEYRPGSTIFFVWQRRQAGSIAAGDFDFGRDLDALLAAPSDDRFMIKVNYWLGL
ncbi:DUF5916 domain-containing protein [Gemmatimonadota bacterium]